MNTEDRKKFLITHVNIRTSISILLLKLIVLELLAASIISILHLSLFLLEVRQIEIQLFNIPLFTTLILLKTVFMVVIIVQWINEYYEISCDFIYYRKGLFFKHEEKYYIKNVSLVSFTQSIVGKIFNFGTLTLYDQRKNKILDMNLIHNPERYAGVIEELLPNVSQRKFTVREHLLERNPYDTN